MARDQDEMAVLYKGQHGGGGEANKSSSYSHLAQPNLDRKPITQDQIREESMKYLTPEQKRHFELNVQLNRRGSLFGPKRDSKREKTPPHASFADAAEKDADRPVLVAPQPSQVTLVGGRDQTDARVTGSLMSNATTKFPTTHASVRGSDIFSDMRLLGSTMVLPSMSMANLSFAASQADLRAAKSQSHTSMRRRTLELEKASLFRIDDWIKMEQKGEYLGKRKHFLRIINTMDYDEKVMQVSNFQMLHELVDFYARNYNSNAHNYVWKDIWGNTLHMNKSLGENGLMDNSIIIDELGLDHFPTILIYFKDGFENEPPMRLDISKPEPDGITVPCRNY